MGSGTLLAATPEHTLDLRARTDRRLALVFSAMPPGADPEVTRRVDRLRTAGFDARTVAPPPARPWVRRRLDRAGTSEDLERITGLPGWHDAVAYVREPTPGLVDALVRRPPALVVYEAPEGSDGAPRTAGHDRAERALLGIAGVVIAPDEQVADRLRSRGVSPTVLPPAAEPGTWRDRRGPRPDPTVGVIADLDGRVDVEVVRAIAMAHPTWRVRVTGATADPLTRSLVGSLPNASVEPEAAPHLVADRNAALDAAVLALAPDTDGRGLCRTVLELLAAGTPVVANRTPALIEVRPYVRFATSPDAIVAALEQELAREDPGRAAARRRVAESYGPDCRLESATRAIASALEARTWAERPIVTSRV